MPAVGMGWRQRWRGRLEVPSPQQATTPGRYWLVRHYNHWKIKKEGEKAAKNGRGDGAIVRTEEKLGDYHVSYQGQALDCPADLFTCPSLPLFPCHLTLLPWDCACWERSLQNSRACWQFWDCLKSCQFNSCVYGLGPG